MNNFVLKCQVLIPLTTNCTKINPKRKVPTYCCIINYFLP